MKTNVLFFAAALLVSTVSFSQDVKVSNSTSATSSANVSSDAASKTAVTTKHVVQHTKTKVKAEKAKATTATTSAVSSSRKTVKGTVNDQASVKADGTVNTSKSGNKLNTDASIKEQAGVSATPAQQETKTLANNEKAEVKTTKQKTTKTVTKVKTNAAKTAVAPKPVMVHSQIKANGGIKIK